MVPEATAIAAAAGQIISHLTQYKPPVEEKYVHMRTLCIGKLYKIKEIKKS